MSDEQLSQSAGGPEKEADPGQGHEPNQQFPVVAVGASAGGLEALTGLLHHLPADTGMAFVVIQHLDPRHESILSKLLARETAMPVSQAEDGTALSPNQVYVIPPNASMTIAGMTLTLAPRESAGTAVDAFLRSLAASQRSAAVAVILSGTGSDGALGVQAVAEQGGIVFAQDPASAKFDGMPRNDVEQLYIDPVECIDCGACVPVCPVAAIFALDDLPEKWQRFTEINASYAVGGKFQGDKFQKRAA